MSCAIPGLSAKPLLPCGGCELVRDVGEAVQSARHHHDFGVQFLTVAKQQAESTAHPLKPAYLKGFDIRNELLLEPLAIADEQLDGYYLVAGKRRTPREVQKSASP